METKKTIYTRLFDAKKEIGKISKDSTNPFYKSKYFDINQLLEHVEPILQKHGLLLLQPIVNNAVCSEIYDIETGESEVSLIELTGIKDPQKIGSEITYYRRYTLQSLLGLQAEDDDANATVKKDVKELPWLNKDSKEWKGAISKKTSLEVLSNYFKISKANRELYEKELSNG